MVLPTPTCFDGVSLVALMFGPTACLLKSLTEFSGSPLARNELDLASVCVCVCESGCADAVTIGFITFMRSFT